MADLCLRETMFVLGAVTQSHNSGSSQKELCSSRRRLKLLWREMLPCLESARVRSMQVSRMGGCGLCSWLHLWERQGWILE